MNNDRNNQSAWKRSVRKSGNSFGRALRFLAVFVILAAAAAAAQPVKAETPAAVTVKFEDIYESGEEFARIDGVDQAGNTLWHLETKHYPAAQLMQCSDIGICNDLYYYAEGGAVITLDLTNGSQVWKNEDFHGSSANGVFDEDGTLYLSGYYRPDLFVTDRAGRTICRKDKLTEDDQWPDSLWFEGDVLCVHYEFGGTVLRLNKSELFSDAEDADGTDAGTSGEKENGGEETELVPSSITASSELEPYYSALPPYPLYTYYGSYIDDGDLDTAWNEGVDGSGAGEYLELAFPAGTKLTGGIIYPGFYSTEELFYQNNAPALLEISSGGTAVTVDMGSSAQTWQAGFTGFDFRLEPEIVSDGTVRVTIREIRKGNTYDDTCISELHFYGFPAAGSAAETGKDTQGQAAVSEQELRKQFEEQITDTILYFLYDDYDYNGTYEAFVVTARPDSVWNDIYYIGGTVVKLTGDRQFGGYEFQDSANVRQRYMVDTGTQKFFIWENSAGGSGSTSYIFGVRNGAPYEPALSGKLQSFQKDGEQYVHYRSDFSQGFHDYIRTELGFDASAGEFTE